MFPYGLGVFGVPMYILIHFAVYIVTYGWAAHHLWNWFAVPYFNAPAVPPAVLVGMVLLVQLAAPSNLSVPKEQSFYERLCRDLLIYIVKPGLATLFGWLIVRFWL